MARHREDIEADFQAALAAYEEQNAFKVQEAENVLFTTFTRDIAEKITITPQYIKDRTDEINTKLWALTKWFFAGKQGYICEDETRTLRIGIQPQKVFTGTHLGRREYSIDDKSIGKSGRHTVAGTLAKNMIGEIFWRGIPDSGTVKVDELSEPCRIGYYQVKLKAGYFNSASYYVFVGKTQNKMTLSDSECRALMELPVQDFTTIGGAYGERDGISKPKSPNELDSLIDSATFISRGTADTDEAWREEIETFKNRAYYKKQALSRDY